MKQYERQKLKRCEVFYNLLRTRSFCQMIIFLGPAAVGRRKCVSAPTSAWHWSLSQVEYGALIHQITIIPSHLCGFSLAHVTPTARCLQGTFLIQSGHLRSQAGFGPRHTTPVPLCCSHRRAHTKLFKKKTHILYTHTLSEINALLLLAWLWTVWIHTASS